ncbi:sensor domain-containing phosphodiesterase [Tenuibacillus multivorans]|uniref:EAL domain, c-di-GMP-specific phosphodiesterase class I (Or its enzymatically inactive variant) n=1 Tax=Tenuibacillus multivorans TaxID=237069 RepID=A0A1G9WNB8_9BACI|nr:EAL domain-containing protein [Tenuibacillus multivorans]GEL77993.1 hypothetical protein TMU01_22280 [Tenuibacillus multivorans]SDM86062.1 EAL domain, c-di-GMP-specific phosphodiesterase class I (or its enzymatically inactive variant) [Tenuibacillus multivorans]
MGERKLIKQRVLSPEDFVEGYQFITEYLNEGIPLRDVLKKALKYFEDRFDDSYCTIMLLDREKEEFIDGVAYTLPDEILENFKDKRLFEGMGACSVAAMRKKFVVSKEIGKDPDWKIYHDVVAPYGLKSCWSMPIYLPGTDEVMGTFAIYSKHSHGPVDQEVETLKAYNELIALIISNYMCAETKQVYLDHAFYSELQEDRVAEQATPYVDSVKEGLRNDEFLPYYQPIFKGDGKSLYGVEALARWHRSDKRLVSPVDFIEHAEEQDFVHWLDEVICKKACQDMKALIDETGKNLMLAVNISAVHIKKESFAQRLQTILEETGFPPEFFTIEITETSLMENLEDVAVTFQQLKSLGCKISIDDFGTTYSSLNYLKYLPVDTIKLDKTFIDDVDKSPVDQRICKTIIQLGLDLNLDVVAEGIETEQHLSIIKDFGCEIYQGYYFSKPLTLEDWKTYLMN